MKLSEVSNHRHHEDKHGFDVASDKDDELLLCIGCGEYHIALDMKYDDLCVECYLKDLESGKECSLEAQYRHCFGCGYAYIPSDEKYELLCPNCYSELID